MEGRKLLPCDLDYLVQLGKEAKKELRLVAEVIDKKK